MIVSCLCCQANIQVNLTKKLCNMSYACILREAWCWGAESINGDATRLAVCGESAGGTMSLVMSMLAKQHQQPSLIKAQVPLCPATDLFSFNSPSYEQFADDEFEVRCFHCTHCHACYYYYYYYQHYYYKYKNMIMFTIITLPCSVVVVKHKSGPQKGV